MYFSKIADYKSNKTINGCLICLYLYFFATKLILHLQYFPDMSTFDYIVDDVNVNY